MTDAASPAEAVIQFSASVRPRLTRRGAAWAIDYALAFIIGFLATGPLDGTSRATDIVGFSVLLAAWYGYLVITESVWKTTLGMKLLRLRVLTRTDTPLSTKAAFLRNTTKALLSPQAVLLLMVVIVPTRAQDAAAAVVLLLLVALSVGAAILIMRNRSGLTVGDRLADTCVTIATKAAEQASTAGGAVEGRKASRVKSRLSQAPWSLRDVVLGSLIAIGPMVALNLTFAGGEPHPPSLRAAAISLAMTVVLGGWMIVWAWQFSLRRYHQTLVDWGFRRPPLSILWLVPLAFLINGVIEALPLWPAPTQSPGDVFPHTLAGALLLILTTSLVVPILEEAFSRGFLFRGLIASCGPIWAAVISAAVFAALHWEPYTFVPLFIAGLLLAWLYYRTNSLWTSIVLHAAMNALATIAWLAM